MSKKSRETARKHRRCVLRMARVNCNSVRGQPENICKNLLTFSPSPAKINLLIGGQILVIEAICRIRWQAEMSALLSFFII